jgi:hypothetical protein
MQTLYFAWLGQKEKLHYTFKEIKIFRIRIKNVILKRYGAKDPD